MKAQELVLEADRIRKLVLKGAMVKVESCYIFCLKADKSTLLKTFSRITDEATKRPIAITVLSTYCLEYAASKSNSQKRGT